MSLHLESLCRLVIKRPNPPTVNTTNATTSVAVGLHIHAGKCMILKYKTIENNQITFSDEALEEVEAFIYPLKNEGSDPDVEI